MINIPPNLHSPSYFPSPPPSLLFLLDTFLGFLSVLVHALLETSRNSLSTTFVSDNSPGFEFLLLFFGPSFFGLLIAVSL